MSRDEAERRAARGQGAAGGSAGANLHSRPGCGLRRSLFECLHVLPRTRGHRRRKEGGCMPITHNLTPYTYYCEYCGSKLKPGAKHECDQKYEEERDEQEKGD